MVATPGEPEPPSPSAPRLARLDFGSQTLIVVIASGPPRLLYWGSKLSEQVELDSLDSVLGRPVPHGTLDDEEPLNWLPETARGFTGRPGIQLRRKGVELLTQLTTRSVEVDRERLHVECFDELAGVAVEVTLSVDPSSGVMSSRCSVRNESDEDLAVDWLAAAALGNLPGIDELELFEGRWCHEMGSSRTPIDNGLVCKENRLGRTSHHSFPAILGGEPSFGHERGSVYAFHLGWSGNHRVFAERLRDGRVQIQLGELLSPGEIVLARGESYTTPPLYASFSERGANGVRASFHNFVRRRILPTQSASARPIHFNTWETLYFDHSEERTLSLVHEAAAMGAERFVLDDGWFRGRTSDRAGLGDWTVCEERYPRGLEPVVDAVRAAGMQIGLWIEPEMINEDSDLCREHPDWLLHAPGRQQPLGRRQYALDLCRDDVFEHLATTITRLVEHYSIDYLKWDMNRDLCHVVHDARPASHRMTEATYRLFDAVRATCPGVEIESCSSGGARADLGILARADRIWGSDNHDPHDRQLIERGYSLFLPPEVVGSHVGSERSEVTGRSQSMAFRVGTALFGHLGIEAAASELGDDPHDQLRWAIDYHREHRHWLHSGRTLYLDTNEPELVARLCVAERGDRALLSVAKLDSGRAAVGSPLRVPGLEPAADFELRLLHPELHSFSNRRSDFHRGEPIRQRGEVLARVGLQLPVLRPDSVALIEIVRSDRLA